MPVRNHIRRLRESHRISAKDLADALGVHPSALSRWESHDREVSDEYKQAVAAYFNLPVKAIFDFDTDHVVDTLHRTFDYVTSLRHRVDQLEDELRFLKDQRAS